MKKKIIGKRILKTGIAVSLALIISSLLNLDSTFAAIVALIGLKETTQKTFRYSLTLIYGSIIALAIGLIIVLLLGNNPLSFGLGTIIIIALLVALRLNEGLILSVIVMYHVLENYPKEISEFLSFSIQELTLIIVGILVSVFVNVILPQKHDNYLEKNIEDLNVKLSDYLMQLADKIANPSCNSAVNISTLPSLKNNINKLIEKAQLSKENTLHENKKEQYDSIITKLTTLNKLIYMLEDMSKETNRLCENYDHSELISKALRVLARIQRFPENTSPSSYKRLSLSLKHLHDEFEWSPLPASRKEFEDRSSLYHLYLDIIEYADELFLLKKID